MRLLLALPFVLGWSSVCAQQYIVSGAHAAHHRGVYEAHLASQETPEDPFFGVSLRVTFTRPDGSIVEVDGFYDGNSLFKARAYCDELGEWRWRSQSDHANLDGKTGTFTVTESHLKGKLRRHPDDPHQFAYDNGDWFLHIGDTGYRYVVQSEPRWRDYIDQAAAMGATKIRTWFAQSRNNVEALFNADRSGLALEYWQEIDRRVIYALNHHPDLSLQLIPYAEDTDEIKRYSQGDHAAQMVARYSQARWSSFPNVQWTITNDREIISGEPLTGRKVDRRMIEQMGRDMAAREPWGTLITNHQARGSGYSFVDEPWSDIITLEDIDQTAGAVILEYRPKSEQPVVLDEDRYERYRDPANHRYFFRRLMWASLLSGGHATYGGLQTYEAYDGDQKGVSGYYDANRSGLLSQGAHDFVHIHEFFLDARLTLVGLTPDDEIVGGDPTRWKCSHDDERFIIYLANPDGTDPRTDNPAADMPAVTVELPPGTYSVEWFDPRSGAWYPGSDIEGAQQRLELAVYAVRRYQRVAGDWVLLLRRKSPQSR